MEEKIYSVRVLKALLEDCLSDGIESLNEAELLDVLEIRPTKRAVDGLTGSHFKVVRRNRQPLIKTVRHIGAE